MKVAVIGKTSSILTPKYELKLSPSDLLILDGDVSGGLDEGWVFKPLEKWAKESNIPYKIMYFYSYKHKPETLWYKEIVDEADKLVVYCDDKDNSITELCLYAINYAKELCKEVSIIKLSPMYRFHFLITERYDDDFSEGFTIREDAQMPYESARAKAMVEAQIEYLKFKIKWGRRYGFQLFLMERKRYGFGDEWVEIKTREIDEWYDSQMQKLYENIYGQIQQNLPHFPSTKSYLLALSVGTSTTSFSI